VKAPGLCNRAADCARRENHDGVCMPPDVARRHGVDAKRFADMHTSEVLRKAASTLEAIHGTIRVDLELAGELRARAVLIERAAELQQRSCGVVHGDGCDLLQQIGQVHHD